MAEVVTKKNPWVYLKAIAAFIIAEGGAAATLSSSTDFQAVAPSGLTLALSQFAVLAVVLGVLFSPNKLTLDQIIKGAADNNATVIPPGGGAIVPPVVVDAATQAVHDVITGAAGTIPGPVGTVVADTANTAVSVVEDILLGFNRA